MKDITSWDEVVDLYKARLNISPKELKSRMIEAENFAAEARRASEIFDSYLVDLAPLTSVLLAAYTTKMCGVIIRAIQKSDADASANPRATIAGEINFMKDKWHGFDYTAELPAGMVSKISAVIAARRKRD